MNSFATVVVLVLSGAAGGLVGFVLNRFISWLLEEIRIAEISHSDHMQNLRNSGSQNVLVVTLLGVVIAVGVVWWEVISQGLLSQNVIGPSTASSALFLRAGGHLVFFWFLAAAAWVDIRYRVIPDVITTPGVICGLLAMAVFPQVLLPVPAVTERSFAAASLTADSLVAWGPLNASGATSFGIYHVVMILGVFILWWFACTSRWTIQESEMSQGVGQRAIQCLKEPRNIVFVVGITILSIVNLYGGIRLAATQSGMIGLVVSAGIVWITRAGASAALGREAMGMGDVTLMAMVGIWLGWQPAVLIFFLATFIGLVHGLIQLFMHRENELPFGPSLCLAAVVITLFWQSVWDRFSFVFEDVVQLGTVLILVVLLTAVTLFIWRWVREKIRPEA
ncbi:A24 family peptidase [bacterium]|jgi:prepilin signal peptidase PulO-like enzyme (type II secretory pathway)|nr:A24 family peptidase [bacterium]